jgi:hypothetical protein
VTGELDPFTYKNEVRRKWDVGSGTRPTQTKFKKKILPEAAWDKLISKKQIKKFVIV